MCVASKQENKYQSTQGERESVNVKCKPHQATAERRWRAVKKGVHEGGRAKAQK